MSFFKDSLPESPPVPSNPDPNARISGATLALHGFNPRHRQHLLDWIKAKNPAMTLAEFFLSAYPSEYKLAFPRYCIKY